MILENKPDDYGMIKVLVNKKVYETSIYNMIYFRKLD